MQCGRKISGEELDEIVETVELFSGLSRTELARTICENLSWFTPSGGMKEEACLKLLDKLALQGEIKLPPKKKGSSQMNNTSRDLSPTARTDPRPELQGILGSFSPIKLRVTKTREEKELCNEYLFRYHYLGYTQPIGTYLRYFITYNNEVLGCALFAGAAKSLGTRDAWIGWTENQRLLNLAWVINNTRFLLLPWVQIKNLASHVLARIARRVGDDWYRRWDYSPVLMETFVDPDRYAGSCYKAAGWQHLGMSTGEGLVRRGKSYRTTPKMIFVKPLAENFRGVLCKGQKDWIRSLIPPRRTGKVNMRQ